MIFFYNHLNIYINDYKNYIMNIKNKNLSDQAYSILSYYSNKNIIYINETLSHDGYDSYGPESDLWDLSIIKELNNDYIFYDYHWENWFNDNQEKKYELWQPKIKLSLATRENIHYFQKEIKYPKFNEVFEEQLKKISINEKSKIKNNN